MSVDFKLIEKKLAENKVYDAWQYVISLSETLDYMVFSYEIIKKVYEYRKNKLSEVENEIMESVMQEGKASLTTIHLNKTNLDIAGFIVDDSVFLKKTTIEFFHYARVSMDVLFQIVNAALLGDQSVDINDSRLLTTVTKKLKNNADFENIYNLLKTNKDNDDFKYLQSFDNYIKHIKTVLITVKNSFIMGDTDEFRIKEFLFKGVLFEECDAIDKITEINEYVLNTIDNVLTELVVQIPNCLDNRQRIQKLKFKMQIRNTEDGGILDYSSFFIEVNELKDLPSEIKVYPLLIKPNDEIESFDFKFDKIFIKNAELIDGNDDSIIGYAELKNGINTNEFYRIFEVKEGSKLDYYKYLSEFKQKYTQLTLNFQAMEGEIVSYFEKDIL